MALLPGVRNTSSCSLIWTSKPKVWMMSLLPEEALQETPVTRSVLVPIDSQDNESPKSLMNCMRCESSVYGLQESVPKIKGLEIRETDCLWVELRTFDRDRAGLPMGNGCWATLTHSWRSGFREVILGDGGVMMSVLGI